MADPFAIALAALHALSGSVAAVYVSSGGAREIRVVRQQRSLERGLVRPHREVVGETVDVQRTDIDDPELGDVILIDGEMYEVTSLPRLDPERITWIFEMPALDRTIVLARAALVPDAHGDPVPQYAPVATMQAARVDLAGREFGATESNGRQDAARQQSAFYAPFSAELAAATPKDRLIERGVAYDILAVAEVGNGLGFEILAVRTA